MVRTLCRVHAAERKAGVVRIGRDPLAVDADAPAGIDECGVPLDVVHAAIMSASGIRAPMGTPVLIICPVLPEGAGR
jgi:hypothetical protein